MLFQCLAAALASYALALAWQHRRWKDEPPVVWSWIPFLGSAIVFGKDPLGFVRRSASTLGSPTFVAVVAGERMVFVTDSAQWPAVFREKTVRSLPATR